MLKSSVVHLCRWLLEKAFGDEKKSMAMLGNLFLAEGMLHSAFVAVIIGVNERLF